MNSWLLCSELLSSRHVEWKGFHLWNMYVQGIQKWSGVVTDQFGLKGNITLEEAN